MKKSDKIERITVLIILVITLSLTSLGYASSSILIAISGDATIKGQGVNTPIDEDNSIKITSYRDVMADGSETNNSNQLEHVTYDETVLDNGDVNLRTEIAGKIGYKNKFYVYYTIENDSDNYYTYNGATINKVLHVYDRNQAEAPIKNPCILGLNEGDVFAPHSSKEILVLFYSDETEDEYGGAYVLDSTIVFSFINGKHNISGTYFNTYLIDTEATFNSLGTATINVEVENTNSSSTAVMYIASDDRISVSFQSGNDSRFVMVDKDFVKAEPFVVYSSTTFDEDVTFDLIVREGYDAYIHERVVGTVTIHPYEGGGEDPDTPTLDFSNLSVSIGYTTFGWANHANVAITINNRTDYDFEEWSLKIFGASGCQMAGWDNTQQAFEFDALNEVVTIDSRNRWTLNQEPISSRTTHDITATVEYLNGSVNGGVQTPFNHAKVIMFVKIDGKWYYNIDVTPS